jgi:hypothetical protein
MVDEYYFGTSKFKDRTHLAPARARRTGPVSQERIRQRQIESDRRTEARIRKMIVELEHAVSTLEGSIEAVLEGAPTRDPSNFAYPIAARAMRIRRDNLKGTIAVLSNQLAKLNLA